MAATDINLADLRKDYRLAALDEATAGTDPLAFFQHWFEEAETRAIDEVNAMTLATADSEGKPHARIVLLKGLDERGFSFLPITKAPKAISWIKALGCPACSFGKSWNGRCALKAQ